MTHVVANADMLATAANAVARIGSTIDAAGAAALGPTTAALAPAIDEVSAAIAALFQTHGLEGQAIIRHAAAFHREFNQALAAAGNAYAQAEAANAAAVSNALGALSAPLQSLLERPSTGTIAPGSGNGLQAMLAQAATGELTALIMGGTGNPLPIPEYVTAINNNYIQPLLPGANGQGLFTPQEFWPNNPEVGDMTFNQSNREGLRLLQAAINTELAFGNKVNVLGYSSSATIVHEAILDFMAMGTGAPDPGDLSFLMLGSPHNPVGGLFARFPGFYIPLLDVPFNGATPADNPYPTAIYSMQYDGAAHAPQYPLNPFATLNALFGFQFLHWQHPWHSPEVLASAQLLPTSPGYTGNTDYYMLTTQNLPLLEPIRQIPYIGQPLAEMIQPSMRVLVDLGYADYGPTGNYADIPTPAGIIQIVDPFALGYYLTLGAVQGPTGALVDLGFLPESFRPDIYPYVPSLSPGLNVSFGQSSVTGISLLTGAVGPLLELIPPPH
ncbi:PE family protein [Mycobacterium spongiae]|uniref:PE-PPE domain-containing protein n=1 Tax=Mycobacterium spongiae TaxID=886343 RepID=A0A975JV31_9MYCO|nr:PE-PPE domain-containing protein [Mycobacterium spongiae]QUR65913.1 PE-PPE domain-containing protein [Mycobacterium spongiae]